MTSKRVLVADASRPGRLRSLQSEFNSQPLPAATRSGVESWHNHARSQDETARKGIVG